VNGVFSTKRLGPASYTYQTVPRQAELLRNLNGQPDSVRLLFLGVPDKWGRSADFSYFKGDQYRGTKRCIKRRRKNQCVRIPAQTTIFPITSVPADKYVMVSNTWEVDDLIDIVDDNLCRPFTDAPSNAPTTPPPTKFPTTPRPTQMPTVSPTERRRFDSLDLYLFLDRSRSMRWRFEDCRSAPGGQQTWDAQTACWQLFLGFAEMLGTKASELRDRTEGPTQRPKIGWRDDYTDPTKGLRVWIYGFACANEYVPFISATVSSNALN
jgi:hypothetical protein